MCLIIASPDGKSPDMEIVGLAILQNPDGWGVVSAHRGRLSTRKGFGLASLTRALDRLRGPYLIHFRFATHGAVGIANNHPFRVNQDCYMVHNGILRIPLPDARFSDSWHFARHYARPYLQTHGYTSLVADAEHFIGRGNKLAFLRRSGELLIANESAGAWRDGLWYSNDFSFPWDCREEWGRPPACPLESWEVPAWDAPSTLDDLAAIVCDSYTEDCEYCALPAKTLYFHPDTNWYVCADCASTLLQEDSLYAHD